MWTVEGAHIRCAREERENERTEHGCANHYPCIPACCRDQTLDPKNDFRISFRYDQSTQTHLPLFDSWFKLWKQVKPVRMLLSFLKRQIWLKQWMQDKPVRSGPSELA